MTDAGSIICSIFKGNKEQELYVYVPRDSGEDGIPEALKDRLGQISKVMDLVLTPDRKLARADTTRVITQIREKGYYLQLPPDIGIGVLHDGD